MLLPTLSVTHCIREDSLSLSLSFFFFRFLLFALTNRDGHWNEMDEAASVSLSLSLLEGKYWRGADKLESQGVSFNMEWLLSQLFFFLPFQMAGLPA